MISIPGSLSFVMLSAPAKNPAGMPDARPFIHLNNQRCPIQSQLQSLLGVGSFYVERPLKVIPLGHRARKLKGKHFNYRVMFSMSFLGVSK